MTQSEAEEVFLALSDKGEQFMSLEKIEELRTQAGCLRKEIARLVNFSDKELHKARLAELRYRYFRTLDEIDRHKKNPAVKEAIFGSRSSLPKLHPSVVKNIAKYLKRTQ